MYITHIIYCWLSFPLYPREYYSYHMLLRPLYYTVGYHSPYLSRELSASTIFYQTDTHRFSTKKLRPNLLSSPKKIQTS